MSKNYQLLIPHAPLGGKFSFISYSNYSIIVQAPRCRERWGISGNAAAAGLWEGLFVALSSCLFILRGSVSVLRARGGGAESYLKSC